MSCGLVFSMVKELKWVRKWRSRLSEPKRACEFPPPGIFLPGLMSVFRHRAGLKEVQILNKLRQADPEDKKHVVRLERTFEHRGHLCLVFESLRFVLVLFTCFSNLTETLLA